MGLKRHENEARRPPFTTGAESHHLHPGGYEPLMTIVNTRGWGRGGQDVFREVQIVSEKSFKKVLMWMCADATLEVRSCDPDGDERLLTRPSITRPDPNLRVMVSGGHQRRANSMVPKAAPGLVRRPTCETEHQRGREGRGGSKWRGTGRDYGRG